LVREFFSELQVIVDFTVEDEGVLLARRYHGLMTGIGEIKDSEPLVAKNNPLTAHIEFFQPVPVWPSMSYRIQITAGDG
jgi:hypothetical protein